MLEFICSYFNFNDSTKIKTNYIKFRKNFPYKITTVELALPNQDFFIEDSIKIRANENNILWQKERCLNIAIENLSANVDSLAWVDTDIVFSNNNLLKDTYTALENYKAVQLFDSCFENPNVNININNISLGKKIVHNLNVTFPVVGFAWAFRRDVLVEDKLYDMDPVGNSEILQSLAWRGKWNHSTIMRLGPEYRKEFLLWAWSSYEKVQGNIGYVPGAIEHLYHGNDYYRKYHSRNQILLDNNFIPSKDLKLSTNQLYSIPDKHNILLEIKKYFQTRTEHENE